MLDRNFWNPSTPQGFTEKHQLGSAVDLYIYPLEHSAKGEAAVIEDVERAAAIWCQAKINVQAVHFRPLGPQPPSEPLNLDSRDLAAEIACSGMSDLVSDQLYSIALPGFPTGNRNALRVLYIPGARLQDGGSGCHRFRYASTDLTPEHLILLTDEASGAVLAHEIGHALMVRNDGGSWIATDPDPQHDPNAPIHNTNAANIMFPAVSNSADPLPTVTGDQASVARASHLVRNDADLVFGFSDGKPFRVGVSFMTLHVHMVDDELFSDDALESTWNFRVMTIRSDQSLGFDQSLPFSKDPLDTGDHTLPATLFFDNVPLADETEELAIRVTGSDWDFWSPNDDFPMLEIKRTKGNDFWGATSTTGVAFGVQGEHRSVPVGSSDINYSLTSLTTLLDQPDLTIFRSVC